MVVVVGAAVVLVVVAAHLGSDAKLAQLCTAGDIYCFQKPPQSALNTDSVQVPFSQQVPIGGQSPLELHSLPVASKLVTQPFSTLLDS